MKYMLQVSRLNWEIKLRTDESIVTNKRDYILNDINKTVTFFSVLYISLYRICAVHKNFLTKLKTLINHD